ncbi:MAG TPA: hypothetical protein VEJ38_12915 [Candidatus Acidoferrales bacterium]|nr:hypothetical protein [Candidatus Acidoferrales bacterium]
MPQSILIFDFDTNEEAAQQARHKVDAWRQGFRLGNKMLLKFEREEPAQGGEVSAAPKEGGRAKAATKKSAKEQEDTEKEGATATVRLLVRLDFSDHEKLSHQRWLDRIPAEEPFKSVRSQTVRTGDPDFAKTAQLFDSLD